MSYDFLPHSESLRIPTNVYRPAKRCRFCHSVFLDDHFCETCGRSVHYHPIGNPFGPKSFYGLKEQYINSLNYFLRFFPQFENYKSLSAQSYVRRLSKRFSDLLSAFNSRDVILPEQEILFVAECKKLIDELILYGVDAKLLSQLIEANDNSSAGQELILYICQLANQEAEKPWFTKLFAYKVGGLVKVDYLVKVVIISATVSTMAVVLKDLISSQFGK